MQVLNGFCSYFPQKLLGNRFQEVGILDDKLTYVKKSTKCCSVVVEEISVTLKGWLIRYWSTANGLPTLICEAIAVVNQVVELVYRAFVILEGNTTVTIISKSHTGLKHFVQYMLWRSHLNTLKSLLWHSNGHCEVSRTSLIRQRVTRNRRSRNPFVLETTNGRYVHKLPEGRYGSPVNQILFYANAGQQKEGAEGGFISLFLYCEVRVIGTSSAIALMKPNSLLQKKRKLLWQVLGEFVMYNLQFFLAVNTECL